MLAARRRHGGSVAADAEGREGSRGGVRRTGCSDDAAASIAAAR